jgi:hypothetical protein
MSPAISQVMEKIPAGEETAMMLAVPEDAMTYLREILKFLGTVALIVTTGLLLLLAG